MIQKYQDDSNKELRLSRRECRTCFYLKGNKIVGHAFTNYTCSNCENEYSYSNTGVPKYCQECSDEYKVCVSCGASL